MKKLVTLVLALSMAFSIMSVGAVTEALPPEDDYVNVFTDVSEDDWFYDDVMYLYEGNLMNGTGNDEFSPNATTTRAMVATILHRMAGSPEVELMYGNAADVMQGSWYEMAIAWTGKNGIVTSIAPETVGVDLPVTREQLVTMLYRYKEEPVVDGMLNFPDDDLVSDWAYEAMIWAADNEIVLGDDNGYINPQGLATRAEICAIIHRFDVLQ